MVVRSSGGSWARPDQPLDSQAFAAADPMETRARRLTLVLALCGLVRKDRSRGQQGEVVLAAAIDGLSGHGVDPTVPMSCGRCKIPPRT